ncbi:hypothetical protein E4T49_08406 [Aureobasidium sp. EXF-10728]|nr:hypothetical protein E4T49_08406 [Aureobasidium sp. EXF-10728]
MRPLRLLLSLSSCLIFIIVLSFVAASKTRSVSAARDHNSRLGAYFSWNSPSSLFPPSAIISLTDDNSTFFLARPAAFGPPLPGRGLSGQIWIGAGFGDDNPSHGGIAGAEGELGCSDVPGWSDGEYSPTTFETIPQEQDVKSGVKGSKNKRSSESETQTEGGAADVQVDGTDDHLHQPLPSSSDVGSTQLTQTSKKAKKPGHADIQSLQETAEIAGKVVLLSRGGCGFLEKAKWVQRRGGVALIVGDDMRGGPLVTMYARGDTSNVTIPSIFTSHTTAHLLSKLVPSGGFREGMSAQDAARLELGLPVSGNPTVRNKKQPDSTNTAPTQSSIVNRQKEDDDEESGSWLSSLFSSSDEDRHDSRRPPSSGKIDWVLQKDFEDETPKKYNTKSTSTTKSTKQTKAPSSDEFVIGVHDWRDPDLLDSQINAAQTASSKLPKSAEQNSAAPHAGPKGGSITPGSGEYHQAGEKPINLKSPKKPEKSKPGPKKEPAADKPKSWIGRLVGADSEVNQDSEEKVKSPHVVSQVNSKPVVKTTGEHDSPDGSHDGLWVTLTPASMSSSPFFDTLLVLVVSPLVTLTIVYALLLLRSRIRRRRWRAPKSVVDRFPVRIYHTVPSSNSSNAAESTATSPDAPTQTTPLLHAGARPISQTRSRPRSRTVSEVPVSNPSPANTLSLDQVQEKREAGLAEWRRRYGGRQRDCAICIDEFEDGVSRVMSLPCGHEFHVDCITPWLTTRRRTCPNCKADVVRSFGRGGGSSYSSSSAQPLLAHSQDDSLDIDDVQVQAVNTRNYDPAANEPLTDLEQGSVDPDRTR